MTMSMSDIHATVADGHAIHPSLLRPALFAGVEPAVAGVEGSLVFALLFVVGVHIATLLLAGFQLLVVHGIMARVAREDPQMVELYLRSLGARDFYHPLARVGAPSPPVPPSIPRSA